MALVTGSDLSTALGLPADRSFAATAPAAAADAAVKAYLGWDPEVSAYTDYLNPAGGADLLLLSAPPGCPVTVTGVWEDHARAFGGDTLLVSGEDYVQEYDGAFRTWRLRRIGRNWPYEVRRAPGRLAHTLHPEVGVVKVTYTVEVTRPLAVARTAALMEGMAVYNLQAVGLGLGVVRSDGMDGASVTVDGGRASGRKANSADGFVSPFPAGQLDPFRRTGVA